MAKKKSPNMIESGFITPSQWDKERILREVATILTIDPSEIERIDYWVKQIWVKIVGTGAKFVSYRSLPIWYEEGLAAIENCDNVVSFEKLGVILREEIEQHGKHYPPKIWERWQKAWNKKSPQFQTEEARLQLRLARQQEAWQWQQGCIELLSNCEDLDELNKCYWKIEEEIEEFEDLPLVVKKIRKFWHHRWNELGNNNNNNNKPGDFWTPF